MSIQDLAKYGRNGDNMMMHVSSGEVAGLDALARANGMGGLTTNPATGAPEAFKLRDALPTIASIVGTMYGGPLVGALASGGTKTLQTGDIEQGFMTGLTSYAGSQLGGALADAGTAGTLGTDTAANLTGEAATAADTLGNVVTDAGITNPTAGFSPMEVAAYPELSVADLSPTQQLGSFGAKAGNVAKGAFNTFNDPAKAGQFLTDNQGALIAGGAGMAGQASIEAQQAAEDSRKQLEEKKFGEAQRSWQQIADSYNRYGRAPSQALRGYAAPYGVTFKEGGSVDYSQRAKDAIQSKYDRQVRESGPVDRMGYGILDLMNVRDPATLRRSLDQYREENDASPARGGSPYAAGGQVGNFNQATGYAGGGYLEGGMTGDGMSDDIPATIDGTDPAALSTNEYVVPADVVSHIGNGSSDAGAERLDLMLDRIRMARTGTKKQAPEIDADKYLPA